MLVLVQPINSLSYAIRKMIIRSRSTMVVKHSLRVRALSSWNPLYHSSGLMCRVHNRQSNYRHYTSITFVSPVFANSKRLAFSNPSMASVIPNYLRSVHHFSTSKLVEEGSRLSSVSANLLFPDFPTIQGAETFIAGIHNVTGLPWWSTIIVSAFFLRTLLPLPLSIYSMQNSARLQRLQPEIKEIAQGLKKEVSMAMHQFGWDQKRAKTEFIKNMKRHLRNLYIRDNCHPMKDTASFWIRLPIWVSASYALRNMSVRASNPLLDNHETCQSLSTEGIAWFTDLTLADSTLILPVMMGAVVLLNVEIGRSFVMEMTTYRRFLTYGLRGLALVFIPISASLPSGMVLYWISSGVFSAIQTVLVDKSRTFQSLIGINPLSETSDQPSKQSKSKDKP